MVESFSTQLPIFWFKTLDSAIQARIGDSSDIWSGAEVYKQLCSAESISAYQLQTAITNIYQRFDHELIDLFDESARYFDELEMGAPVMAMLTAPDLASFCQLLSRYSIHIHPLLKIFSRETENGEVELWGVTPEYIDETTLMTHISLGLYFSIMIKLVRRYLNEPNQKLAIHIHKNTIGDEFLSVYERVFNVEMKEGFPARYLLFPNDLVQAKPRQFQADFHAELVRIADQQMEKTLKTNLIYKVNETFKVLAVKDTNLDSVANNLHISPRTLNRKLKQQGVSFRRLFDKYRLELSMTLLNQNDGNITYVAHELGFSDSSAFSRAFKNWTGHSPTELRS
ncbi:helix-turn-helix domain-containing protein [Vibrio splendidus]|jgi:AraC-like DNA-binding protein|uniref:helix-turn-helix domain-containing protein n=1 Tax=Vibrio splendidus TaxID=29497 RepID=UPI000C821330|nr:helix-turn-helix transcriptional regulator [Vibrio splendidus]PMN81863.1 Fis family transcriptional regulator [Vibrio splendidus]PMO72105.1 Fis family transcriptional regulator [Vibrio splendidus]